MISNAVITTTNTNNINKYKEDKQREKKLRYRRNRYLRDMIHILEKMNPDLVNYIVEFVGTSIDELKLNLKQIQIQNFCIQFNTEKNLSITQLRNNIITKLENSDFTEFYLIVKEIFETVLSNVYNNDIIPYNINYLLYGIYGFSFIQEEQYESIMERKKFFNIIDKKNIMNNIKKYLTIEIVTKNKKLLKSILSFE
jgi:hypothetical protein